MRKPKSDIEIKPSIFLIIGLIICVTLIFFSFRYKEKFAPIRTFAGDVISPMQKGVNSIGKKISNRF